MRCMNEAFDVVTRWEVVVAGGLRFVPQRLLDDVIYITSGRVPSSCSDDMEAQVTVKSENFNLQLPLDVTRDGRFLGILRPRSGRPSTHTHTHTHGHTPEQLATSESTQRSYPAPRRRGGRGSVELAGARTRGVAAQEARARRVGACGVAPDVPARRRHSPASPRSVQDRAVPPRRAALMSRRRAAM